MRMKTLARTLAGVIAGLPWLAFAFNSGSTGADGAFNPTVSQEIVLPPAGVFNFTNVNIPSGVTITFRKNAANTPVVMLASGDVVVAGVIGVGGNAAAAAGANGSIGDDAQPGLGGTGGFDGGRGGKTSSVTADRVGGPGMGPGGGGAGYQSGIYLRTGGGGAFGTATATTSGCVAPNGQTYGSALLLPLIGGSGGGGGTGGPVFAGSGGGGGGGAILIAASGTINVTGSIRADGGNSGASAGDGCGAVGGGGSGGAIRLIATTVSGNGTVSAAGGVVGALGTACGWVSPFTFQSCGDAGANGGAGRVRIEAENLTRTAASVPAASVDVPGQIFIAGMPTLSIVSVAGVPAPANPTGNADISLPATTANPVTVEFRTTAVPVGNIVKLTVAPAYGNAVTAYSPALVGTTDSATASVQIALPAGPSTLQAQTTYTIVAALGDALGRYANNERVERVQVSALLGGESMVTLITVSGKEYRVPAALLAMMPS